MNEQQAPRSRKESSGAPAWMGTFADLMSLLMCFFVLLLSFSEMDVEKFKQIAASMQDAFGVQREVYAEETPMGTSIIAQEFSAGKPQPTITEEVRQATVDDTKQTLEFTDAFVDEPDASDTQDADSGTAGEAIEINPQTEADAEKLKEALSEEIKRGMIQIEADGATIVIRIREKGSFPSGLAQFSPDFVGVLDKLSGTLEDITGRIVVAGHTDDVPIKTAQYRSNWDLSAARAVSVVHELLASGALSLERFLVEGHADARPLVPNDSAENRALNRRVELTILQGDDGQPKPFAVLKADGQVGVEDVGDIAADAADRVSGDAAGDAAPPTPFDPDKG